ncbi:MAG: metallophosphoesterase family protein, partial [Firmicutes bacterium]|nr:metallophosphoesterase family protein [Candidatus Caballimonas caccae]
MKYLICSDIHGSKKAVERILELKKEEKADKVVFLGDIYNHGPRNPFPDEYNPMDVASLINSIKEDLIVVKGNCDSEVDTLISEF